MAEMQAGSSARGDGADYLAYWGKAGEGATFHRLAYHSLDVAATGLALLEQRPRLRALFAGALGVEEEPCLRWLAFWLALHDIGKFSIAFQSQRPDLLYELQGRHASTSYTVRHDSLGAKMLGRLLFRSHDVLDLGCRARDFRPRLDPWIAAVAGHHGQPPKLVGSLTAHANRADLDAAAAFTQDARVVLLPDASRDRLLDLPEESLGNPRLSWWLAGLAVLADWLGSNVDFFPYCAECLPLEAYWEQARSQAASAVAATGLAPRQAAGVQTVAALFDWQTAAPRRTPTPLQQWAQDVPLADGSQLFLLEDVTGSGKTEAALVLAQRLVASERADGLFFGLPTMATANAMYERVGRVAGAFFDPATPPSVVLAHGQRKLNPLFRASVLPVPDDEDARSLEEDETASARCAAWFADSNKKALLADIGVGTLDQALLGIVHARHQSLRLLGLFRKVLIVDEVHACDAYMQKLLETLLTFHAAAGGHAILLTATLTRRMKQALVAAFCSGIGSAPLQLESMDYPLATHVADGIRVEGSVATRADVCRTVAIDYLDDEQAVIDHIGASLRRGRCVCWIRNTVVDAVDAWRKLAPALPDDAVTLFHARFAMGDRLAIERDVLERFGPQSGAGQRRGRLVIATQVIEQSLDVDFDELISDLAPIDRLIQRAGRLQRHPRDTAGEPLAPGVPDRRGEPVLTVFGPAWTEAPAADWYKRSFPRAAFVYPHVGQLWCTAHWLNRHDAFRMPDDARAMVESVFDDDGALPVALREASDASEGKAWADRNIGDFNALELAAGYEGRGDDWAPDLESIAAPALDDWGGAAAATRLGEPTVTVRLARREDGRLVPWCMGETLAAAWEASSLRLPARVLPVPVADEELPEAVRHARETMPDRGKWSRIMTLHQANGDDWETAVDGVSGREAAPFRYNARCGLQRVQSAPDSPTKVGNDQHDSR